MDKRLNLGPNPVIPVRYSVFVVLISVGIVPAIRKAASGRGGVVAMAYTPDSAWQSRMEALLGETKKIIEEKTGWSLK